LELTLPLETLPWALDPSLPFERRLTLGNGKQTEGQEDRPTNRDNRAAYCPRRHHVPHSKGILKSLWVTL
jgi:hypothetical protein